MLTISSCGPGSQEVPSGGEKLAISLCNKNVHGAPSTSDGTTVKVIKVFILDNLLLSIPHQIGQLIQKMKFLFKSLVFWINPVQEVQHQGFVVDS